MSVFISYSHDSPEHEAKVLELAVRLRGDGFTVVIDQDELFPPKGWTVWMTEQIEAAQFVLVICTERYGAGRGTTREHSIIDQDLYAARGENPRRFIPVLLRREDLEYRPQVLQPYSYFVMDGDYGKLCRLLKPEPAKPDALWKIPARNEFFSGRDDFLEALHKLAAPVRAIQGLGGLGKTQTAIEFAYRYRDEYTAGFWMTADSRDALVSGFAALGDQKEQDLAKAARGALRWFEENSGWLLILDNVEDWKIVKEWLPAGRRGLVLITTRLQSTGTIAKGLDLPKMTPVEGAEFLLRRAKVESPGEVDRAAARKIAEEVGGLPLALDQAGAFMEEMQVSAAEYLKFYGAKLRARRGEASDHDSVTVTFTLAFEKLGERAKDIVRMCAFLAPDAIPEELLLGGKEPDLEFREAVAEAGRFSLIQRNATDKSIDIHRLVQEVVKDGMDDATRRSRAEQAVEAVNSAFPYVEFEAWPQCERLLPHAQAAATLIGELGFESGSVTRLLNQTGLYLGFRAQYQAAEPLFLRSLAIRETAFGSDHPDTAEGVNNLAMLYRRQGRFKEAEPLYQRAIKIDEMVFGPDHSETATDINNLGMLYWRQERYDEAEPLLRRALAIYEKNFGPDHPETSIGLNNLGLVNRDQRRPEEAEQLTLRALAIRERALGPDHPYTATSLNNLANVYCDERRLNEAEPLYQRALAIYHKAHGPEHPDTVSVAENYAALLRKLGREDEARALEVRFKLKPQPPA